MICSGTYNDHRERVDPATSDTCHSTARVEPDAILGETAQQVAEDEEEERSEEDGFAAKDVGQSAGDDLEGGVGEEEGRSDPADRRRSVECAADLWCCCRDGGRIEEAQEEGDLSGR